MKKYVISYCCSYYKYAYEHVQTFGAIQQFVVHFFKHIVQKAEFRPCTNLSSIGCKQILKNVSMLYL